MLITGATVSIVIPAYNEEATIRPCLLAAILQTVPASEIIVVDNRSTDGTAAIVHAVQVEYPDAPIIYLQQNEEQGLVPTRNFGLDHAQGEVLGRIDADSIIEPNWVEEVQKAFQDPSVAASTGPVLYYDMPLRRFGLKADDTLRQLVLKLSREYHFLFGSNMAIRREAWQAVRLEVCRDQDDELHEDIDLSVHLARHAFRVAYVPKMVSGMSARRLEDSPRDYAYYALRFDRTYARHGIRSPALRAPIIVFLVIYPLFKTVRAIRQRRQAFADRK
ncbi:glycosyltransferase family 2 protein [Glaciihabitans sp. UYNi722]|uniref:glycosyltransferase n=1 Tax=Glaciihabitans sp. UYNi722 TaxID=3156344 RepID=UPI00339AAD91